MTGDRFEAVFLTPEGWVVLAPWIVVDGHRTRQHVGGRYESGEQARKVADALNAAVAACSA